MKRIRKAAVGVDIGTSSISAVVTDARGRILATRTVRNPSLCEPTPEGRHEQDPDAILAAVNGLLAACGTLAAEKGFEIATVGWTGQMHGLVAVDRQLRALTPFVTWRDRRCAPPRLGVGIMDDWRRRKVKGIYRALTIPGYVIARLTGRCVVDATFRASMGTDAELARFAKWIPETDDASMIGDNQAGVYAALKMKPRAAVVNIGTSGQLSRVAAAGCAPAACPDVSVRPFPGGRTLLCRASHVGGAPLAALRKRLRCSWQRLNDEAETNPRIAKCLAEIVDDLAVGIDMKGVRTIVGVGNALRLNPCVKKAVERRFGARCVIPDVEEMAAWGAALYALEAKAGGEAPPGRDKARAADGRAVGRGLNRVKGINGLQSQTENLIL